MRTPSVVIPELSKRTRRENRNENKIEPRRIHTTSIQIPRVSVTLQRPSSCYIRLGNVVTASFAVFTVVVVTVVVVVVMSWGFIWCTFVPIREVLVGRGLIHVSLSIVKGCYGRNEQKLSQVRMVGSPLSHPNNDF